MSQGGDSLYEAVAKIVLGILRQSSDIDYRALYGGTILYSDGNLAAVQPDDRRLGNGDPRTLSNCRVRRLDGATSVPTPNSGVRCLVGWEGGDESKRYCLVGFDGQGTVDSLLFAAQQTITLQSPLTIATADLQSQHELGQSAGVLSAAVTSPATLVSVEGDDTSFLLTWNCADSMSAFTSAVVTLGRAFGAAPRCVASATDTTGAWVAGMLSAKAVSASQIQITWNGSPLLGPGNFSATVVVRG